MIQMRIDESRERLREALAFSLGSYTEQEAKKADTWRDQSLGQLYAHLAHEIQEIRVNLKPGKDKLSYLIHNAADAVNLSAMILAKALEMEERNGS